MCADVFACELMFIYGLMKIVLHGFYIFCPLYTLFHILADISEQSFINVEI